MSGRCARYCCFACRRGHNQRGGEEERAGEGATGCRERTRGRCGRTEGGHGAGFVGQVPEARVGQYAAIRILDSLGGAVAQTVGDGRHGPIRNYTAYGRTQTTPQLSTPRPHGTPTTADP